MQINFQKYDINQEGNIVFLHEEGEKLSNLLSQLDVNAANTISRAIKVEEFTGKKNTSVRVVAPVNLKCSSIIVFGMGKGEENNQKDYADIGGNIAALLNTNKIENASIVFEDPSIANDILLGCGLRNYVFNKYFTTKLDTKNNTLLEVTALAEDINLVKDNYNSAAIDKIIESVNYTKDLVSEPSNGLDPEIYADKIRDLAKLGLKIEILGEKQMAKLGMHALLGVGQGSEHESALAIMRYDGGDKDEQPLAFVGKGVCFDTGGISIKPSKNMHEMKFDMGGSATVVGLMHLLASRKAKVNAVGVVGLVENMPDGKAQNPGDVVKSMSGQTIEVLNTDAEGRLVLADALWYTQEKFNPKFMIDLATLTGAVIVGLGTSRAGLFSNDDNLSASLFEAGKATGEEVWRLPLADVYDKQIDSKVADVQNIGVGEAGSITAAQFLQRFVNDCPWVHLDIAGTAWSWSKSSGYLAGGAATGYGVRLLNKLIEDNYEA